MAVHKSIAMIDVKDLYLDSKNPRLGRHINSREICQDKVLNEMEDWTIDELAVSFIESGYWPQEALVIIEEDGRNIVLEGNRRLAALKLLLNAADGYPSSPKWKGIANLASSDKIHQLRTVPCMKVDDRIDVRGYLGFRHVTGIKQWPSVEKACYITHLIDEQGLTYEDVMRLIGSKTPTVRQHYFAYRLLLQIEQEFEDISIEDIEASFSIMYLSLRSPGTKKYLHIDFNIKPSENLLPVPSDRLNALYNYCRWLFGTDEHEPIVRDSRQTDIFGEILGSTEAVTYLEQTPTPHFEVAERKAKSEEIAVFEHIQKAIYEVEQALSIAHMYTDSNRIFESVERLDRGTNRLVDLFPDLRKTHTD